MKIAPSRISKREWLAVTALLLLAFALRTHDLLRVPPGLHNDEVAYAEITETVTQGRLAIFFPENIGNEGLAYYFAAPFMKVLGPSVLAIRLPAAFISLIAACLIWALTRRLFGAMAAIGLKRRRVKAQMRHAAIMLMKAAGKRIASTFKPSTFMNGAAK